MDRSRIDFTVIDGPEIMRDIVLLEDHPILRDEIASCLDKHGHAVTSVGTLADFWPLMPKVRIAIIDITLPDGSGFDAVDRLRALSPRAGIIVLTARGSLDDKLAGLAAGADHYLVKPFSLLELSAIIEALKRRVGHGWSLDPQRRELINPSGAALALSTSEFAVLEILAKHQGEIVDRRFIVEAMGHDWLAYDLRRLDSLVSRLRHRWMREVGKTLPLKTEHGRGYRFTEGIRLI
ncbi:Two component transcriptional regulator, winged helix family [Thiocapsa sp. KS1]|nr:Two component transcriptional regulator, winged helix family [Thiocapsa sp. KS1]